MFLLPVDCWTVRETKEKGKGVFACKKIKKGTVISDYLGTVIKTAEYDLENDKKGLYLMYFTDQASIYPDVAKPGPHLLNHSCAPNCWMYVYKGHTLFFALKTIQKGDELTISYLLSPNEGSCSPCTHVCKCRSKHCVQTMHLSKKNYTLWQAFLKAERKKTRRTSFSFGTYLPPLASYPHTIPFHPIYSVLSY